MPSASLSIAFGEGLRVERPRANSSRSRDNLVSSGTDILDIEDLTVRFGGVVALDGVSFNVRRHDICGVIGPNGAGKTTLFNCLSRLYEFNDGQITFEGKSLGRLPSHAIAGLGIGRTFQNLALFNSLTVLENIMVGGHRCATNGFLANALGLPVVSREEIRLSEKAWELARFVNLFSHSDRLVADLPFGIQKRVELARALASEPKLLLLDEPAAGLNHEEVSDLRELIWRIRDELGVTVLLVEHHMNLVMKVSNQVVALNFGRKIAEGRPEDIQRHPDVVQAYLGTTVE